VHRKNILIYVQQVATLHSLFYLETVLRVSGGTTTHHQERKQLYLQHLEFVTHSTLKPDAVDTVVCVPDDGWRYHPKHVEQFPVKINCVTLQPVGYIVEQTATLACTALTDWFCITEVESVYCAVGTES
jgi:hypothetical protein